MKTIVTRNIADPSTKYPLTAPGLDHLQQETREALDQALKGIIGSNVILWGMVNSTPGGATFTLSAGAMYGQLNFPAWSAGAYTAGQYVTRSGICYIALNNNSTDPAADTLNWIFVGNNGDGQIFNFDAQTITVSNVAVIVPVLSFPGFDPTTFTDGSGPFYVHSIVKVKIADQLTGTGIIDYTEAQTILGAVIAFTNGTLLHGYLVDSASIPTYRMDVFGNVIISGYLVSPSSVSSPIFFTLPSGMWPTKIRVKCGINFTSSTVIQIVADPNGNLAVQTLASGNLPGSNHFAFEMQFNIND